jgi:hypothetical protein
VFAIAGQGPLDRASERFRDGREERFGEARRVALEGLPVARGYGGGNRRDGDWLFAVPGVLVGLRCESEDPAASSEPIELSAIEALLGRVSRLGDKSERPQKQMSQHRRR